MREVDDDSFEREVLHAERPVVVDFWAPWCGPCERVTKGLERLAPDWDGRAEFVKVDVDSAPGAAARAGVLALPTVVVFAGGEARATVYDAESVPAALDAL